MCAWLGLGWPTPHVRRMGVLRMAPVACMCVRMCIVHAPLLGPTRAWHGHVHVHVSTCVAHVSRMCRVQGACRLLQHASSPPDLCSPD